MVLAQLQNLPETLSVLRGEAEDLINALDQLSDIAPVSDELLRQVDTWATVVSALRNAVRAEANAESARIL